MKLSVVASSQKQNCNLFELENLGGLCAGVCYMKDGFEKLMFEPSDKTKSRIELTKKNGHHSVFDHPHISLQLENIPKALAMVLNNEKMYTTSEKSSRYTLSAAMCEAEQVLYDKWLDIFKDEISQISGKCPSFFTPSKIVKLAQENARYMLSVFTPTSMVYTCSLRQLNYIIFMFRQFIIENSCKAFSSNIIDDYKNVDAKKNLCFKKMDIQAPQSSEEGDSLSQPNTEIADDNCFTKDFFSQKLCVYMEEFVKEVQALGLCDDEISPVGKNKKLSLFRNKTQAPEIHFGEVYQTVYNCSFATLAQLQRHRTIGYEIVSIPSGEFYVPPILRGKKELEKEWLSDLSSLKSFPQATLVTVCENGTLENFALKLSERKCSAAQLEVNDNVNLVLTNYYAALTKERPQDAEFLKNFMSGARCSFPGFICPQPCGYADGILQNRII